MIEFGCGYFYRSYSLTDKDVVDPPERPAKKRKTAASIEVSSNGSKDEHSVTLSPTLLAANDPPDLEELQKALQVKLPNVRTWVDVTH